MSAVQEKKTNPTATTYSNVPGYDPNQPPNSAQNRTAIGNYQAGRPTTRPSAVPSAPAPRPTQPATPSKGSGSGSTVIPKSSITPQEKPPDARTQSDINYNKNVESTRETAPGYISTGSPKDIQVRQEEVQAAEQRYQEGGFVQEKSTTDQFAKQRESALAEFKKTPTAGFDYAKYPGSAQNKYYTPKNYLTSTGQRSDTNVQAKAGTPNPQQKQQAQQRTLDDQLQNIQLKLSRGVGLTAQEELIYHTAVQQQRDVTLFGSEAVTGVQPKPATAPSSKPTTPTPSTPKNISVSINENLKLSEAGSKLTVSTPTPKTQKNISATINVSSTVLAESDKLRKESNEPSLEQTIPLQVVTYKTTPTIKVSESILAKSDQLRKQEGEPPLEKTISLEVFSYRPVKEPTINVSSTVLAQSDQLRKQEGEKPLEQTIPLTVTTYKNTTTEGVTSTKTEYVQSDNLKQGIGAYLAPFAFIGLSVISAGKQAVDVLTGKYKPGERTKEEQQVNLQVEKTFGTAAVDPLSTLSGSGSLETKVAVGLGAGVGFAVGLVGGGKEVVPGAKVGNVNDIIAGVKSVEEMEPISQKTVSTSKPVGKITTFEQVGIQKTEINVNPEIAKLEPQVIRESETFTKVSSEKVKTTSGKEIEAPTFEKTGGTVKAQVPQPPKATIQESLTGISRTGKPEEIKQPPKATLTQPEAIGEPKIPVTIVSKNAVAYFTGPSSKIVASDVLATEITEKQAASLGFTKEEGLIRSYRGQLTEDVLAKMEKMGLADVGLQFTERTSEASKVAEPLAFEIAQGENLGKFSGLRPAVTRIVTGGGRFDLKRTEAKPEKLPEDIFKEDTAKAKGEIGPHFPKQTMEEIQNRYPLKSVKEELIPDILSKMTGTTTEPVKETPSISSPLGLLSQQKETPTSSRLVKEETETISLRTPSDFERPTMTLVNKTSLENIVSTKELTLSIPKKDLGTEKLTDQVSGLLSTTKQETELETDQNVSTVQQTGLISLTRQAQSTSQITKQQTKQVSELVSETTMETPPPTKTETPFTSGITPPLPDKYNKLFEKRKKGKSKKRDQFTGNAPLTSVVGLTKGQEVVYGKAAEKRASQSFRSTRKNELVLGENRSISVLKPQGNKFTKEPKRKMRF